MSFQAMAWATRQRTGDALSKLLLLTLANYADERNKAWPSQARLCDDTEMSERTIRNKLDVLVTAGLLSIESVKHKGGTRNIYTLDPPARHAGADPDHRHHVPEVPAPAAADPINDPVKKNSLRVAVGLSESWAPQPGWLEANHPNLRAEDETAKFREYHLAKGSKYLDWDAAFRLWCRRSDERLGSPRGWTRRPDVSEENRRRLDEYHRDRHPAGEGRPTWD